MLTIGLLLVGTGVSLGLTASQYEFGRLNELQAVAAVLQVLVAGGLALRIPGAWLLALGALAVHVIALALFGVLYLVFVALPMQGGGPFTGHAFNPIALGAVIAAAAGGMLVYGVAAREVLALRHRS